MIGRVRMELSQDSVPRRALVAAVLKQGFVTIKLVLILF